MTKNQMEDAAANCITSHAQDLSSGARFDFGANWERFLQSVNEAQIEASEVGLRQMLECDRLDGTTFLDIGSGSGLSSLAARRLGAKVSSFDYDPQSVACTQEMRRRFRRDDPDWKVESGSILDSRFVSCLPACDIVYSWGVLHHTGAMWEALDAVAKLVHKDGALFIAIYNDQGGASNRWRKIKRLYNRMPGPLKWALLLPCFVRLWGPTVCRDILQGHPRQTWRSYLERRGMTPWRDVVDWVGGYPFEVARPEEIFRFYRDRGFRLKNLFTCGAGHGCNEYVFVRETEE